jgi:hypothetical protein
LADNPYICERDGGLLILSPSGETYHANGACQCKAYTHGMACWHRAAAQLVKRYREAEAAQLAAPAPMSAPGTCPLHNTEADERAALITDIQAAHHRACPFESIALKLHRLFGVTKLEDVSTDDLARCWPRSRQARPNRQRSTSRAVRRLLTINLLMPARVAGAR